MNHKSALVLMLLITISGLGLSQKGSSWITGNIPVARADSSLVGSWIKEAGVRLDIVEGSLESFAVVPGSVINLPDGRLRMYYQASEGIDVRIFSAVSSDGGLTWTREGLRLDVFGAQEAEVSSPCVVQINSNLYRMYYAGFENTFRIFSAQSTDGLTWTREGIALDHGSSGSPDAVGLMAPVVLPLLSGGFRMYYAGFDGTCERILSATSTDGLTWSREPGIRIDHGDSGDLDETGAMFPFAMMASGKTTLFYTGGEPNNILRAILSATSDDGLTFTKEPDIIIDLGSIGALDSNMVYHPLVIKLSEEFRILYSGIDSDGRQRILSATSESIDKDLVGYWKFDEDSSTIAHDSSGYGNDGTLVNGPLWVNGIYGKALNLDSSAANYVDISSSPSLTITGDEVTLECWIKPTVTIDQNTPACNIVDKTHEFAFILNHDGRSGWTYDGKIRFVVILGPSYNLQGVETLTNIWEKDHWYHLAGTYDGNNLKIYVNGVLENIISLTGDLYAYGTDPPAPNPLTFGSWVVRDGWFYNGVLDEVKIYNYALTSEQVVVESRSCAGWSWIGLKNSDDVGTSFDLKAEVYVGGVLVGSGELLNLPGGSNGFNNAKLREIPIMLTNPQPTQGQTLEYKLYVRVAQESRHRSGTVRLWYNDGAANSSVDVSVDGVITRYYLRYGSTLSRDPGMARKSIDVLVDRAKNGNPWKPFGTWTIIL